MRTVNAGEGRIASDVVTETRPVDVDGLFIEQRPEHSDSYRLSGEGMREGGSCHRGRWERWLWEVTRRQRTIIRKEAQYLLRRLASEAYSCRHKEYAL
jgi:hypothetical protein